MPRHHFIKEPLEYRVDHGVAKLWMIKAMHRSALGEIREAHRQTQLPCLQSFASQLADHPRAFAQGKYQRRRVVRLVVRQRGVAGDRGTILYL